MLPHLFWIDIKWLAWQLYYTNSFGSNLWTCFLCMCNLGHRHFHWRIIVVLTQNPTVLMLVDITGAPKLAEICRNMGICYDFRAVTARGKYLGFILFFKPSTHSLGGLEPCCLIRPYGCDDTELMLPIPCRRLNPLLLKPASVKQSLTLPGDPNHGKVLTVIKNRSLCSMRKDFNYLCHLSAEVIYHIKDK